MPPTNNQRKGLNSWRNFFPITNLLGKSEDPQLKRGITTNLGHRSLQAPIKPVRPVIIDDSNASNPATKLAFGGYSRKPTRKPTRKSTRKSQRKSKKKSQRKSRRRY
jgi:hypothetical protein